MDHGALNKFPTQYSY